MNRRPRLTMVAVVCASGFAGFLASALLLRVGLRDMAVRYALAAGVAYAGAVALLRWWVARQGRALIPVLRHAYPEWRPEARRRRLAGTAVPPDRREASRRGGTSGLDLLDALDVPSWPDAPAPWAGGRGGSGGGGASGSFECDGGGHLHAGAPVGRGGSGPGADVDVDLDAWPVLAALCVGAIVACMAGTWVYVVWAAPDLLTDLAFESVVAVALYRRLGRGSPPRGPWRAALVATRVPALLVLVVVVLCALALEHLVPGAATLRDVVHAIRSRWMS